LDKCSGFVVATKKFTDAMKIKEFYEYIQSKMIR